MLTTIERALARVDILLARITGLAVFAVMFIIVFDVIRRYAFGQPIAWVYDLVSIYFINMTLYLIASDTLRSGAHIALDLRFRPLPKRAWSALQGLAWVAVDAVLLMAAWVVSASALRSLAANEIRPGLYEWPVWLETAIVAFGLALLAVRVTLRLARFVASGFDGDVFTVVEPAGPHAGDDTMLSDPRSGARMTPPGGDPL